MKIIKNQKNFKINTLLESIDEYNLLDEFWETFDAIIRENMRLSKGKVGNETRYTTSYSVLSSAVDRNLKRDPDNDFKILISKFAEAGWDASMLSRLFTKHGDTMAKDYDNGYVPINPTGITDYFMFKMTSGKVLLMGYSTQDISSDIVGDEAFFKFYYGYNQTPYGKKALIQHFGSLDKFYDYLGENFSNLLGTERTPIIYGQSEFMDSIESQEIDDLASYYSYDKSSKIGTLDLAAAGVYIDNTAISELLVEFLESAGFKVQNKKEGDQFPHQGGKAVINDGVVKLYFAENA